MINLENCVVTKDSITISKKELKRLIKHYDEQINYFWKPKPLAPQSWGVGLYQGKRDMWEDFLKLINGELL